MLAIGLVLNTLGIGLFCWAIIALAVYALPFFVALIIGMMTFHSDAGLIGAMLIATAGGALTLVLGLAHRDRNSIRCSRRRRRLSCGVRRVQYRGALAGLA